MFFILSKTLPYLFTPLALIFFCFIAFMIIKNQKWKKRMLWSAIILFFFFTNDFIANEFMLGWEIKARPYKDMREYKLGIVLTGATISDLTPNDRVYFHRGADRVTHAVQLYKLGLIHKILISGGSGRLFGSAEPEAVQFKKAMILMGVPETDIMLEPETRNTAESAKEVKKMLDQMQYNAADCLLITSAFHMRRSLACYRKAGLVLEPFSTDFYAHKRTFYPDVLFIPKLDALVVWYKLFREWLGFIAYKVAGYI